ncbi:MAG TPA: MFS transporter [Micromonospora sp.]|nr:MFS transporter [Micromonospora sp.]
MTLTLRQAQRRYLGLAALRWFASGLMFPVQVLLFTARGLDLPTTGLLLALYAALIVLLELPSGSLADLLGRRRTMLLSHTAFITAMAAMAVAQQWWHFAGAVTLSAIGRALGSGPLEAWYVDTVRAADATASLRTGLSRGWAIEALGLGVGAIIGGAAPRLFGALPADGLLSPFSVPALGAAAIGALSLLAHALFMAEPQRRSAPDNGVDALRALPGQIAGGIRLAVHDPVIRLLMARTAAIGLAIVTMEILSPLQFAALLGGPERAAAAYGLLATGAWLGVAAGSGGAPGLCRIGARAALGNPLAVAALCTGLVAVGIALLGLAAVGVGGFLLAATGYLAAYLFVGVPGPLVDEVLHERVTEAQRATLLSVGSLALQFGGLVGSLGVVRLAEWVGFGYGWLVAALAVLLGSMLTLSALRRTRRPEYSQPVPNGAMSTVD